MMLQLSMGIAGMGGLFGGFLSNNLLCKFLTHRHTNSHVTDTGACVLLLAGPGGIFLNSQIIHPDEDMLISPKLTCRSCPK